MFGNLGGPRVPPGGPEKIQLFEDTEIVTKVIVFSSIPISRESVISGESAIFLRESWISRESRISR